MQKRNDAAVYLGYLLPNLHTQLVESHLAKTDMNNHLQYSSAMRKFHEEKDYSFIRLFFQEKMPIL
jgi:ABC-2 type transport system permease protein